MHGQRMLVRGVGRSSTAQTAPRRRSVSSPPQCCDLSHPPPPPCGPTDPIRAPTSAKRRSSLGSVIAMEQTAEYLVNPLAPGSPRSTSSTLMLSFVTRTVHGAQGHRGTGAQGHGALLGILSSVRGLRLAVASSGGQVSSCAEVHGIGAPLTLSPLLSPPTAFPTDDGQSASTGAFSGDASVFIPTDTTRLEYAAGLLKRVRYPIQLTPPHVHPVQLPLCTRRPHVFLATLHSPHARS